MATSILVDTNVWLDVINGDPAWYEWSAGQLDRVAGSGSAAINVVIFAELSVRYDRIEDFENAIRAFGIARLQLPFEAGFLAAKAFQRYRGRGGARRSTLPDFFIGAHAAVSGLALLTRDARRYREYFPRVRLIAPASA
jgi:predicted nucleic acid-binding protein